MRRRMRYRPSRANCIFGGIVGIIFTCIGLFVAIPAAGAFGVLWTLIALAISATTNPLARRALEQLSALRGCEAHSTVILSRVDSETLNRLGMYVTCDPIYEEEDRKYHKN